MRKNIVWGSAAFAVFALFAAPAVHAADETEHVTQVVHLDPGGTLRLKNFSGRVTITGTDRPEVSVDAVRRATRDRLDRIKLDVHAEGNAVVIDANHRESTWTDWFGRHDNVVETDLDVKVPRRTNLDVRVFSSPVTATGVEGTADVHAFSAGVTLSDIVGPVQAQTFSGSVTINARRWEPADTIDVHTFSGNVELRVPDSARGTINFRSFSGRLSAAMPLTLQESTRRTVTARLGDGSDGGTLRLKTFSGNVRIDRN